MLATKKNVFRGNFFCATCKKYWQPSFFLLTLLSKHPVKVMTMHTLIMNDKETPFHSHYSKQSVSKKTTIIISKRKILFTILFCLELIDFRFRTAMLLARWVTFLQVFPWLLKWAWCFVKVLKRGDWLVWIRSFVIFFNFSAKACSFIL